MNFLLNRAITFRDSSAPFGRAFVRYCGVASLGLVVNYAVYSLCILLAPGLGISVTPAVLPVFIAAGVGAAMVVTFVAASGNTGGRARDKLARQTTVKT